MEEEEKVRIVRLPSYFIQSYRSFVCFSFLISNHDCALAYVIRDFFILLVPLRINEFLAFNVPDSLLTAIFVCIV